MGQLGYNIGDLGWSQLSTTDPGGAMDFYSALVGWERKEEPEPDDIVFGRGDEMLGGISKPESGQNGPGWMPYVTVEDLDAALAKVEGLGGTIVMPKTALPEDCGHIATIRDPQGVVTGLAQYVKRN